MPTPARRRSAGSPRDMLLSPLRDAAGFAASPLVGSSPATHASPAGTAAAVGCRQPVRDSPARRGALDLGPLAAGAASRGSGEAVDESASSTPRWAAAGGVAGASTAPPLHPLSPAAPSSVASGVLDAVLEDARAQRAAAERALVAASRERRDADTLADQAASEGAAIAGAARAADAQARLEDALVASEGRVAALEARLRSAGVPLPVGAGAPPRSRPRPATRATPPADPFDDEASDSFAHGDDGDGLASPAASFCLAAADDRLKASVEARRRLSVKLAREQVRTARLRTEAGRLSTALAAAEGARAAAAARADAAAEAASGAAADADEESRSAALEDLVAALRDQVAALGGGELGKRLEAEAVARGAAEERAERAEAALARASSGAPAAATPPHALAEVWAHLEAARASADAQARAAADARAALEALQAATLAGRGGPLVVEVGGPAPAPATGAVRVTLSPSKGGERGGGALKQLSPPAPSRAAAIFASFATSALRAALATWRSVQGSGAGRSGVGLVALALALAAARSRSRLLLRAGGVGRIAGRV